MTDSNPATSFEEAYVLIEKTLNAVEDEFSNIAADPNGSKVDGRLYAPQKDNMHPIKGKPKITRLRSTRHETYIGDNGSIEIRFVSTKLAVFTKPGADGFYVSDL